MKYLLTMICLLAAFTSCHKDDDVETPQRRTVLVYMAAENSLSGYFSERNINQMIEGSKVLDSKNHLIVFVDEATKEMPYIAEIANGKLKKVKEYTEDIASCDPREMRDIIRWTAENYPAEDYGLVLWGHASGWIIEDSIATSPYLAGPKKAFGIDNGKNNSGLGSDNGQWMNIPSMAQCIAESGIKFKYIFADACCFQCVENVYELRNATDWLIGSPAEIPGYGAPYDAILPYLFSTSPNFYKGIIDEYAKSYSNSVPLSAARTSEAASLAQAANLLWGNMPMDDIFADGCIYYFGNYLRDDNHICYDAYDIVRANTDEVTAEAWSGALDKMIAYSSYDTSRNWESTGHVSFSDFTLSADRMKCLSMFVPLRIYDNGVAQYNEMIKSMAWYYASGLCNYMN